MSRHATSVVTDPAPAAPLRVEVSWVAIVARDDLGASTNALLDSPAPEPAAPDHAASPDPRPAVRRLTLAATLETIPGTADAIAFTAELEENGTRRPIVPPGRSPGSVTIVGDHVHLVVESPDEDETAPLLTVVMDTSDRPVMVRSRLGPLAGLAPGAAGRGDAVVRRTTRGAGSSLRGVLAE